MQVQATSTIIPGIEATYSNIISLLTEERHHSSSYTMDH